ncbi:DNA-binding NarL/FixJ family response regulator [Symbiobacterium terraclitae]|uniref:Stage 0 sporulation protein A homolog n=1 Tax=Symbiobacterium terraclitae TaxID=557451 RepID=A0ABS4JS39_9FIRM|nr:DNA-binding NarL/FixJ family response regulator [Symbiobacterium terraclitae]
MDGGKIRIMIVDDQSLLRRGLAALLNRNPDMEVVAEAGDGEEALRVAAEADPDVILMDVRMPVLDGVAATRELVRRGCRAGVIILTTFDDDEYIFEGLAAGARGYLLKDAEYEELSQAIRTVASGESLLQPQITTRVLKEFSRLSSMAASRPKPQALAEPLTERELEVLRLMASGASNQDIAAALYIGLGTVKHHVRAIFGKLGARDRVHAVLLAQELHLV